MGKGFSTVDKIKKNPMKQLITIPKGEFSDCFETWKEHAYVSEYNREYFEEC